MACDSDFAQTMDQSRAPLGVASKSTGAPAPPAAFGRYRVMDALGTGGFGTVYKGHDEQLDRTVAIKVHRGGPRLPVAQVQQFLQEARRLAGLRHPGIVAVHDVGLQDGQLYIVSDYIEGIDLAGWLKEHSPSPHEAARIAAAVADALAHAHARVTIHRDVKPANIIMTRDRMPVLVDFGLGLDEESADGREKDVVSGTPMYMSPEQAAGAAHRIDGRTDIYSLGTVLYEMLCGRVPFRAPGTRELLRQVREDEPQPPRQLKGDIPPDLERACLKALAKRQQDRYTTAADFADDLRRAAQLPAGELAAPASLWSSGAISVSESQRSAASFSQAGSVSLPSSRRSAREAERRQITVLVCGCMLFESEAYLENLDAEAQAEVLQNFQQVCELSVRQFDGTVVQCNEQGVLVCFGYPVAFEDAAQRAAKTGLCLLSAMKVLAAQLRREHDLDLDPWAGIHTGPAVVEMVENTISLVGEARNVALRLEDAAQSGQVVCTAATHRLIRGGLECVSLGQHKIKGVAQPVELFRVEGVSADRSPIEAAGPLGMSPLIGRDHEINLLLDRWEQAQEGIGQVILLSGDAGLGKSRLVHALKEHVLGQMAEGEVDAPVIEWRCSRQFQNTGLYPAIDFYERALAFGSEEPPQERFDRLLGHLEAYGLARPEVVPLWAALLSLSATDRFPALPLSRARQREETFRALLEWLSVRASRTPVLFVIEDLHWADASTLEFLGHLFAEGLHDRVLTVLTFRPEFQIPWPAVAHHTSLALNRLTRGQAVDLMKKMTGGALPNAIIDQIFDRAGGVPLFVEEFTKMVQESGVRQLAGEGGTEAKGLLAREIPATLQNLVLARLDRMEGEREVAQLAATLGREFSFELMTAVAVLDEPTLQAELAKLVQAEILYQKGRPPRSTYVFKHALLEDALYNTLVKSRRQQFHRRAAEAFEARFPQTALTRPELVAHHFTEAGMPEKAVGYWLQAGLRSRERSAETEAISHLTQGRALLHTLDETPERDARELELLTPLGTAYLASHGYAAPEVGPIFLRARELCERVGDPVRLFALMLGIWEWHTVRGDLSLCMELAGDGMTLASRTNDPGMLMEALFMSGETMLYRGEFAGARDCFATAVAQYEDRETTKFWAAYTGHNASVTHRSNLAVSLWHLGYPDQAFLVNREMRQLALEIGHPFSVAYAQHHTAWLYQHCRLGEPVQSAAEQELEIATEQGFALWHATGTFFLGAGKLLQGDLDGSLPLLLEGHRAFRAGGAELTLTFQLSILVDAYTRAGRYEDARRALDEGLAIAEKNDERCQEAELLRQRGDLILSESPEQTNAAGDCFQEAIEKARRQRSKGWELRATISLARLWQGQGRRAEAHQILDAIYSSYSEGWTTPDLVDAAALLEALA
jgi:serine/threonine protein kinase/tetratricopeptide (TPR) repeat protein